MEPGFPHGLFFRDTRFLSELRLRVNGHWPEPLAATTLDPFSAAFVLRDLPRAGLADSALLVFRTRYVGRGMREDITVRNYGLDPAFCSLELSVAADFADLFEVKEGAGREGGRPHGPRRRTPSHLDLPARAVLPRRAPRLLGAARALADPRGVRVHRARRTGSGRRASSSPRWSTRRRSLPRYLCGRPVERSMPAARLEHWRRNLPRIETDHDGFRALLDRVDRGPRRAAVCSTPSTPTEPSSPPVRRGS